MRMRPQSGQSAQHLRVTRAEATRGLAVSWGRGVVDVRRAMAGDNVEEWRRSQGAVAGDHA